MGTICIKIDDILEKEVRTKIAKDGGKKGSLTKAIEAGLRLWLKVGIILFLLSQIALASDLPGNVCRLEKLNFPCNAQDYIQPSKVENVSKNMTVNNGTLFWNSGRLTGVQFTNWYKSDSSIFIINDYWQTPEKYISRNFMGDCEDSSLFVASVLESKKINATIIYGLLEYDNQRAYDFLVEYSINNVSYRYYGGIELGITLPKDQIPKGYRFTPILKFDKNHEMEKY